MHAAEKFIKSVFKHYLRKKNWIVKWNAMRNNFSPTMQEQTIDFELFQLL